MTLGRKNGKIKIKTDGGLRAVECACCASGCATCNIPNDLLLESDHTFFYAPRILTRGADGAGWPFWGAYWVSSSYEYFIQIYCNPNFGFSLFHFAYSEEYEDYQDFGTYFIGQLCPPVGTFYNVWGHEITLSLI